MVAPSLITGGVSTNLLSSWNTAAETISDVVALSGSDRAVVVLAGYESTIAGVTIDTATWGGASLIAVTGGSIDADVGGLRIRLKAFFGLDDVFPTDTTDDIVVTASSALNNDGVIIILQLEGCAQAAPGAANTDGGSNVDPALAVAISVDESLVIASAISPGDSGTISADSPLTEIVAVGDSDFSISVGIHEADTGTDNVAFTDPGNFASVGLGFAIQPVASAATDLSGTSAAVSGQSSDLQIAKNLSGTTDSVSGSVSSLQLEKRLSGAGISVSGSVSSLQLEKRLSGQADAVSGSSSNLTLGSNLQGQASVVSGASSVLQLEKRLSGSADAVSGSSAGLTVGQNFSGALTAVSGQSSNLRIEKILAGTAASVSGSSARFPGSAQSVTNFKGTILESPFSATIVESSGLGL